jgi:hypothetical protein
VNKLELNGFKNSTINEVEEEDEEDKIAEGILSPVGSVDILESVMLGTIYIIHVYM